MEDKSGRVLVATAAPAESRLLRSFLEDDYSLTAVGLGAEALRKLSAASDIDLVLIAGSLPDMSDVELVRAIREIHSAQRLPLIMLAGDGGPDEVTLAFQSGADNCLMRPFTEAVLSARVKALLNVKHSFDRAQAKNAELEAADIQRYRIYRMASHDLQSPLNNIRLAESSLRSAANANPSEVTQSLDMIRQMVDTMGDIIADYLDVMELDTGSMKVKLKPINLRDVIVNVVTQFAPAARMKNISLEVGSAQGWVIADARRLVQILGNLVSNAIKYSPYKSTVKIYTSDDPEFGLITVEDEGPGIPPADRARLFQEYGKLSTHPTGGEARTGLGLWIVRQLVEAQEGVVGADFPETGGSRFWIGFRKAVDLPSDDAVVSPVQ